MLNATQHVWLNLKTENKYVTWCQTTSKGKYSTTFCYEASMHSCLFANTTEEQDGHGPTENVARPSKVA